MQKTVERIGDEGTWDFLEEPRSPSGAEGGESEWPDCDDEGDDENEGTEGDVYVVGRARRRRQRSNGERSRSRTVTTSGTTTTSDGRGEEFIHCGAVGLRDDGGVRPWSSRVERVESGGTESKSEDGEEPLFEDMNFRNEIERRGFEVKKGQFDVNVSNPETCSEGIRHQFTSYLVKGYVSNRQSSSPDNMGGGGRIAFSARKRYSDFEWLRRVMQALMPGVAIPALPAKQIAGRFESNFIEARRLGLLNFLVSVLNRPHLAEMDVVFQWLQRSDSSIQLLKTDISCQSWENGLSNYRRLVSSRLRPVPSLAPPRSPEHSERRPVQLRWYLARHLDQVKGLCKTAKNLARLNVGQFECLGEMANRVDGLQRFENAVFHEGPVSRTSAQISERRDSADLWMSEQLLRSEHPSGNFDLLAAGLAIERRDTECMLSAVASVEDLRHKRQEITKRIASLESQYRQLASGVTGGSSLTSLFSRKDPSLRQSEIEAELSVKRISYQILTEWESLACAVLESQFDAFAQQQVRNYNRLLEDFARRQMDLFVQEVDVWKSFLRTSVSARSARAASSSVSQPELSPPPTSSVMSVEGQAEDGGGGRFNDPAATAVAAAFKNSPSLDGGLASCFPRAEGRCKSTEDEVLSDDRPELPVRRAD